MLCSSISSPAFLTLLLKLLVIWHCYLLLCFLLFHSPTWENVNPHISQDCWAGKEPHDWGTGQNSVLHFKINKNRAKNSSRSVLLHLLTKDSLSSICSCAKQFTAVKSQERALGKQWIEAISQEKSISNLHFAFIQLIKFILPCYICVIYIKSQQLFGKICI